MDTDLNSTPTTDEEVEAILSDIGSSNKELARALIDHYQCGRALEEDILTAYRATLVAFAGAESEPDQEAL